MLTIFNFYTKTMPKSTNTKEETTQEETTQKETNEETTQKEVGLTQKETDITSTPKNRGTGAGGSNTNKFGKKFEEKTSNISRLFDSGYTKTCFKKSKTYYLSKEYEDRTVIFV